VQTLQTDLVAKLSDSTQSDLVGIAYEDFAAHWNLYNSSLTGATDNKQSSVQRSGNNSQPYVISY
jgi:hypothetical protein